MISRRLADNPIAIVGVAGLFPQAGNYREFWQNVVDARDCTGEVPASRWNVADYHDPDPQAPDRTYARRGAFVPDVAFDPLEFGLPPNQLEVTSTLQTLSLVVARDLLRDAGAIGSQWYDASRTGVVLGVTGPVQLTHSLAARLSTPVLKEVVRSCGLSAADAQLIADKYVEAFTPWQENTFPGLLANVAAGRIANRLGLGGMTSTVDAACASSMSAVRLAIAELLDGRADLMITGGCDTENSIFMYMCFSKTQALSKSDEIKPFDSSADGTLIGEGIGMLALKRLADAQRDGDRVYAVIRGIGSSSDGRARSIYAPLADGQRVALQRAYQDADCSPASVGLFEAHATGTPLGDATELSALTSVLRDASAQPRSAAVGSVKSQIGHLKGAAGAASLIKMALSLYQKTLPPTINVRRPHEVLADPDAPVYPNTRTRPWIRDPRRPARRAAASAMGFGGVNFHVVLEEHGDSARVLHRTARACLWHAPDTSALLDAVRSSPPVEGPIPADAARIGFVAADESSAERLRDLAITQLAENPDSAEWSHPAGIFFRRRAQEGLRVGALFAGQGGQYLDMGLETVLNNPVVAGAFDDANDGLLADVVFPPPTFDAEERRRQESVLHRTENAQPAIGALSAGQFRYLSSLGLVCSGVLGHSFGELTALWAAGSLGDADFFRLAHARGAAAVAPLGSDPGTMAAIQASHAEVSRMLESFPDVTICNHNGPEQIVVGGGTSAVGDFLAHCKDHGVTAKPLSVSGAFHTRYVAHAVEAFRSAVAGFGAPRIPVYANSPGASYGSDPEVNAETLVTQIAKPVDFVSGLQAMRADGCTVFVEFGPRQALTQLVKRNLPDAVAIPTDAGPLGDGDVALKQAAVRLAVLGAPITDIDRHCAPEPVESPSSPSAVLLNAAEYVPSSRHAAYQAALTDDRRISRDPASSDVVSQHLALHSRYLDGQLSIAEGLASALRAPGPDSAALLQAAEQLKQQSLEIGRTHIRANEILSHIAGLEHQPPTPPPVVEAPVPVAPPPAPDAPATLLEVVADKTGYPLSMLDVSMDLEADLGVDSIKRVQIVGVLQERFPGVPVVGPERLAELRTIGDIAALMGDVPVPVARSGGLESGVVEGGGVSVEVVLEVVADKTGYPLSMLDVSMDLEADLGVDSIKRVQIVGVLQERFPGVPVVGPERLAELRTIGDIAALTTGVEAESAPRPVAAQPPHTEPVRRQPSRHPVRWAELPAVDRLSNPFRAGRVAWVVGDGEIASALRDELERLEWTVVGSPRDQLDLCVSVVEGLGWDESVQVLSDTVDLASQAVAPLAAVAGAGHRAAFVTVTRLDDASEPGEAVVGGVGGVVKTLAREHPELFCRALNIDPTLGVASVVLNEIHDAAVDTIEVAVSEPGRRTPVPGPYDGATPAKLPPGSPELTVGADDLLVVSGGARGVTAACVGELATRTEARFILLGRTEPEEPEWAAGVPDDQLVAALAAEQLTPRELRETRDRVLAVREMRATLEALGDRAEYISVDVSDREAVRAALKPYRQKVTGIVHGAGVISDALLTARRPGSAMTVLRTKILGLRALLDALGEAPIRHVVLFTSVAGLFGNVGQADYAAANEALCRVAASLKHRWPSRHITAIDWGAWEGGMVTPELREVFQQRGVDLVSLDAGAKVFADQFTAGRTDDLRVLAGGPLTPTQPLTTQGFEASRTLTGLADTEVLQAHRLEAYPLLPATFGLGWMVNVIERANPGRQVVECHGFEVHKGIVFDPDQDPDYVVEVDGGRVRVCSKGPHYSGTFTLAAQPRTAPEPMPWETGTGLDGSTLYTTGELFHGRALQGISRILESEEGRMVLECRLPDWPVWQGAFAGRAHSPVLADLLMQGACVLAARRLGEACLPLSIERAEYFAPLPDNEVFVVIVDNPRPGPAGVSVTVTACAPSGSVLMRLTGVSVVAAPGLAAKFAGAASGHGEVS
ncbi:SDR family NAD(P)-dependent oxidoreductase [Actinocrispum sp. NPDC049592]|uniref:SDR family NAD(P)-dependent oxidoreductase n=1 Tax=Actinocrispum sp. NPDC049592 TaxID=3154835 RepID=UPI00342BD5C6